jgi:hypothetical protein
MNLIEHQVVDILSKPYEQYGKWWVKVSANSYGVVGENTLMFDTKEQAENIKSGYWFDA